MTIYRIYKGWKDYVHDRSIYVREQWIKERLASEQELKTLKLGQDGLVYQLNIDIQGKIPALVILWFKSDNFFAILGQENTDPQHLAIRSINNET